MLSERIWIDGDNGSIKLDYPYMNNDLALNRIALLHAEYPLECASAGIANAYFSGYFSK